MKKKGYTYFGTSTYLFGKFEFYCIPTIVGYLLPKPVYTYIYIYIYIYDF